MYKISLKTTLIIICIMVFCFIVKSNSLAVEKSPSSDSKVNLEHKLKNTKKIRRLEKVKNRLIKRINKKIMRKKEVWDFEIGGLILGSFLFGIILFLFGLVFSLKVAIILGLIPIGILLLLLLFLFIAF